MEDQDLTFGHAEARLWLKWVFANLLASLFVAVLTIQLPGLVRGELATILGYLASWPFGILVLAFMQWLVLRRWMPRARGWLIATVLGVFLYSAVIGLVTSMVTAALHVLGYDPDAVWGGTPEIWLGIASGALLGASIGTAQWLVLRRRFLRAGWWTLATAAGWAVAAVGQQAFDCMTILSGFAPAALTGIALVWLVRQTLGEGWETAPPPVVKVRGKVQTCPHCGEQVPSKAAVCRYCQGWLVDRPQAAVAGEKQPAEQVAYPFRQGRLWGMLLAMALGALAALALPVAALVARAQACGLLHSSVIVFAVLALTTSAPAGALPAVLAWIMGRRRAESRSPADGDFSVPRGVVGGVLGVIIGVTVSATCACMTFAPECL